MPTLARTASCCLAVLALAGCAAEPAPVQTGMGVLVKLARPTAEPQAVVAEVEAAAGRPARYQSSVSEAWHALFLRCDGAADCEALLQRLRADTTRIAAAQRDERKRIVSP
jgi:hypothetical protein